MSRPHIECYHCHGSGGGDDRATKCPYCCGRGYTLGPDEDEDDRRDREWDERHET